MFRTFTLISSFILLTFLDVGGRVVLAQDEEAQLQHYRHYIRPVLDQHCFGCHNEADKKAGLNLEAYDFVVQIIRRGELWVNVIEQVSSGQMPPDSKPRLTPAERDSIVVGIGRILDGALQEQDPGQVILRRLSNREYRYTVMDLTGVDFDARSFFPADGSGGEGFDNQARVLFLTALQFERYYEATERILDEAYQNPDLWRRIVPQSYVPTWRDRLEVWWTEVWQGEDRSLEAPRAAAQSVLVPFATRAYRRMLDTEEKNQLLDLFTRVYTELSPNPERFDQSIQETLKAVLLSPYFLYRREADLPLDRPYRINGFELATRLSYFLWSSMPDDELLNVAYHEDLHDPDVLAAQVERMLLDPKSVRFAESFGTQWLEIDGLTDDHEVDAERYPGFSNALREAMVEETVRFMHHIITERRSLLELLDSDYTFLNETLATHYGVEGRFGPEFRKVTLAEAHRGGVLGMGAVLTATSFPTRTSPVNRGKWVLEQLLGTPPPPPPPDVPELEEAKAAEDELDLRELLSRHRAPSTCHACHAKMDPIGLGLENFDAIGRWREQYGEVPIEASGVLSSGEAFNGPAELKAILKSKQDLFARNLTRKTLSYALGRGIRFEDKPTVDALTDTLLVRNFDPVPFFQAVVTSFPFRYKKSDLPEPDATLSSSDPS